MATMNAFFLVLVACCSTALGELIGVPTVPFTTSGSGAYDFSKTDAIVVDNRFANVTDTQGWTLIPATLIDFASTFAQDLSIAHQAVQVQSGDNASECSIFLTLDNSTDYVDAAGRWTSEAYTLNVQADRVIISGASPLGVWWGTRSLLQQVVLNNGSIPIGSGIDSPGWNTRGIFLDAGRHFYPKDFIVEMCNWISFWKQNTFHLHLSDNLYNNVDIYSRERQLDLYARFRLLSNDSAVEGLNIHANESYTREGFDEMQHSCAARGVTIIPEIEAPGHALVISQWKPELGLEEQLDLLNISYPDTIPTMKTIWQTFMPWFHSKVIHIGADEYVNDDLTTYQLATLYNRFVNAMNGFIGGLGKSIRIWGTYPPQANYTNNISTNVTIQHWEFFEDNPKLDYISNGYNVINSDDAFYIVQKYSGGAYAPNIYDTNDATNNVPRDSPYVPGHIAAQWNDYGPNTSTYLEAYYSWRDNLAALADKQWGGNLTEQQYDDVFETLQAAAPAQNLDRKVSSKTDTILQYDLSSVEKGVVRDTSGNQYDGHTDCRTSNGSLIFDRHCSLTTPLSSKGQDYTLSFSALQHKDSPPGPLFTGPDSELRSGNGTSSQLMLVSAGNAFALNYTLPIGVWTDAALIGRGNRTFFAVDGGEEMEFTTTIGINGESFVWAPMQIVAPLSEIGGGGWKGEMRELELVAYA
ncbi:hypothetical protein D0859_08160 [Hortaea werneckii]|uniref:beta-N-acetylhexosaminidase n=1 Tax=Hortaea werneckii TaxID=91943 RepID=A0A3M7IQN9_HORWE|nr:hypothetical protein D0859_08160 [Hortaea werneckii]